MGTPSSFIPHEYPLVGVEEYLDLLHHFSCLLSGVYWLMLHVCGRLTLDCK